MRRRTGNIEAGKPPRKQAMKKSKFADTFFGRFFKLIFKT